MGFVISNITVVNENDQLYGLQNQLSMVTNSLTRLTAYSANVYTEQTSKMQAYLNSHKDEEGQIMQEAFDYVNSAAFTAPFDAKKAEIQAKETRLQAMEKNITRRIQELQTNIEGQDKLKSKNIENFFNYGK